MAQNLYAVHGSNANGEPTTILGTNKREALTYARLARCVVRVIDGGAASGAPTTWDWPTIVASSRVLADYSVVEDRTQPTTFVNTRTGQTQTCRIDRLNECADDPMNVGAPMGDIYNDARRRDLRDGCPACTGDVEENASEPDVRARWEL